MAILRFLDKLIFNILKTITIICLILLTLIITANIILRYFPITSLLWSDEIIGLLFAYLVFYGTAALWISREHFSSGGWFGPKFFKNEHTRHFYRLFLELVVLIFSGIFFYYALQITITTEAVTNVLTIPKRALYSCMPISGAIMIIYSIRNVTMEIIRIIHPAQREVQTSVTQ